MILVAGVGAGVAVCVTTTAARAACRMTVVWVPHAPSPTASPAAATAPMRTLVLRDIVAPCSRDPGHATAAPPDGRKFSGCHGVSRSNIRSVTLCLLSVIYGRVPRGGFP